MKNITVSVDDEVYRRARVRAAERGTSVSRVVKDVITEFAHAETAREQADREREAFYQNIDAQFQGKAGEPWHESWRDELYASARTNPGGISKAA
jgi:plasmid stability protein